ncbi:MAG TPA: sn-glycerol-1-phosphate dehydrogenase [Beutenbergiaceae bacterium]|nr:sn-glycerol-1-phosphate dehydrogenase [Beutenbergiaceae bacterium]
MAESLIDKALQSANDTQQIVLGTDVLGETGRVFTELFGADATAIVVADRNTYAVAGEQVQASLQAAGVGQAEPYIFPGSPTLYAGYDNVALLRDHLAGVEAIAVSVAAGTLNDVTKLASSELGRQYMNVATAASMDGYAAYGSSITKDGFKQTINCPAPAGLIADLPVMAAAPARLTATGYGDLIEKLTAGADWILSDELGIEAIDRDVWTLVQGPLRDSLADPQGLVDGDLDVTGKLAEGLMMSGLAMQAYQSSRPASGAGHQFSHLWEMEKLGMAEDPPLSHGFKVGLGTVSIAALFEVVLRKDLTALDVDAAVAAWPSAEEMEARVRAAHGGEVVEPAVTQSMAKYIDAAQLRERLEQVRTLWPQLAPKLQAQLLPAADIQQRLATVGAISHPAQIGLDMDRFRQTYDRAQMIRSRYTVLDLLLESNLLEECVAELFAPDGFWGAQSW